MPGQTKYVEVVVQGALDASEALSSRLSPTDARDSFLPDPRIGIVPVRGIHHRRSRNGP